MNKYIIELIKNSSKDEGKCINELINNGMITINDVARETLLSYDIDIVINTSNYVKNINRQEIERYVIKTFPALDMYKYAKKVFNASLNDLGNAVIDSGDIEALWLFAHNIDELEEYGISRLENNDTIENKPFSKIKPKRISKSSNENILMKLIDENNYISIIKYREYFEDLLKFEENFVKTKKKVN